jgi:hypothetical protein
VRDETLEFGHRGWLLDESFIFYDRQTDSLWVQATGQCIYGRFKGEQLATLPLTHTTWGQWRVLHPDTVVLEKPIGLVEKYRLDSYARRGLPATGLAVFVADAEKIYPLARLNSQPVLHDTLGGQPVLIVFHQPSETALAYDPIVSGSLIAFELAESTARDVRLRDPATGQMWSGLTGQPESPADSHAALRQLGTTRFSLEHWSRHFPNSPVYRP